MVSFGLKTSQPGTTFQKLLEIWTAAERCGFASAWIYDHLTALGDQTQPTLEAWTLLAALAARTERIRVGVLVTDNALRHPAMLAREAVTVDQISGGRLEFGIGAGNPRSEIDYRSYGITSSPIGERISKLDEACQIFKALWTQETVSFSGRFYNLDEARPAIWPVQKPHPPIWIGGSGDRVLRITARYADGWNFTGPLDRFTERADYLRSQMARYDRSPDQMQMSAQFFLRDKSDDQIRDDVQQFVEAGATSLMAIIETPYTVAAVEHAANVLIG